MAGFE